MKALTNPIRVVLVTLVVFGATMVQAQDARRARHAKQSFLTLNNITLEEGGLSIFYTIATVPEHTQLVLDYFSCNARVPGGQYIHVSVFVANSSRFSFLAAKQGTLSATGEDLLIISQQVRILADPGAEIGLQVDRGSTNLPSTAPGRVDGTCSFAGQLTKMDR